jgi:hypothetical protein
LIQNKNIPAKDIIIGGSSAGAFLCFLLMHALKENNEELPSRAIFSSFAPYNLLFGDPPISEWPSINYGTLNFLATLTKRRSFFDFKILVTAEQSFARKSRILLRIWKERNDWIPATLFSIWRQ